MPCARASGVGIAKGGPSQAKEEERAMMEGRGTNSIATATIAGSMAIVFEIATGRQLTWEKAREEASPAEREEARATIKEEARDYIPSRGGSVKEEKVTTTARSGPKTSGKRVLRHRGHWRV